MSNELILHLVTNNFFLLKKWENMLVTALKSSILLLVKITTKQGPIFCKKTQSEMKSIKSNLAMNWLQKPTAAYLSQTIP